MLERARNNLKGVDNVEFRKANCEDTGLPPESFDTAFMANVILIVESPEKAPRESYRILRHGGRLFVLYYSNIGMGIFDRLLFMVRFMRRLRMPPYRRMFSPDEISKLARDAGFDVESVDVVGGRIKAVFLRARKP